LPLFWAKFYGDFAIAAGNFDDNVGWLCEFAEFLL
jgi:hypothetical protein